ncbi:O-antigen ligase family protein [Pedobacter sp. SD-b]|uniref:O-antigen ligase family protein n=1 Tax=Pedobacter segetis TaxID=2793069 RepID=A0ABS1BMI4_9SPHI|nr:O-antigen ligase family protein [Pedobacter segetis]MBK0384107.1 O-antigen ligase family protein [Pedobacter segetis]
MVASADIKKLYGISILSLLLAAFIAYRFPSYFILILPPIFLLAGLFILSIESVFFIVAFCSPFSIKYLIGGSGINLPDEPLMIVLMFLFIIKMIEEPSLFKPILKQPLTLLVTLNLGWILITSVTSTLPMVSFKFLFARLWTVTFGYFWGVLIFKNPKNIKKFILAFGLGLCVVVIYSTYNHYGFGFSQKKAMLVMKPLMDDHTVYSAVCSMVLAFCVTMLFLKNLFYEKLLFFGIALLSLTGVILSYSRAAALSLVFVLIFSFLLKLKIRFKTLSICFLVIISVGLVFSNEIYQRIRLNHVASGKNLIGDIKSISNVNNDESNVERLNRWESGFRMFKEKPFLGFGPGTYQFQYSGYQKSNQMTSISTTHGDMGNAHSEYFGPLIESGVIGFLIVLMLFGLSISILMKLYYQHDDRTIRMFSLAILLSLLTYYFHGMMNDFLDQDKAAVLVWALLGMATSLNLKRVSNGSLKKEW